MTKSDAKKICEKEGWKLATFEQVLAILEVGNRYGEFRGWEKDAVGFFNFSSKPYILSDSDRAYDLDGLIGGQDVEVQTTTFTKGYAYCVKD